jgi:hypothetical protein
VDPNNLPNQLATILHESFIRDPKGRERVYQKPYPDYYEQLPYPRGYRVPEFSKCSGEDGKSALEHVSQFILQCGEASANDALKLKMFPLSLSGTAFTWFTSLAPNSIFTWAQLEQKFHEYFYSGDTMLRLSQLTIIKQKHNEPFANYIRRFRDTRNRCFNLNISDKDLADLAYSSLSSHLREKLESHVVFMLPKSYKRLWIVKAELKIPGVVISLETIVPSTWSNMVASHRKTMKPTCA